MPKENVILIPHAALGEGVIHSGRAKLYHQLGFKVFVSPTSQLRSNPEAYEMLYLKNPYISGTKAIEEDDNVDGIVVEYDPHRREIFNPGILTVNIFSPLDRKLKLYYEPQIIEGLEDVTLLDMNISSYRLREGGRDSFENLEDYVRTNYPGALSIKRRSYDNKARKFESLSVCDHYDSLEYNTIYDYCDLVASCKKVVCLQTGSQMLACYYNRNVECLKTEEFLCQLDDTTMLVYIDTDLKIIDLLDQAGQSPRTAKNSSVSL